MKTKLIAFALILSTAAGIALFPLLRHAQATAAQNTAAAASQSHRIEVVFILDTTSSMSGLIQAAKEKIWSIATTMASARQQPDIKMGLVAYRDRGDSYVTKVLDLSTDLDSMYASLMDFKAEGGGDNPESVNQALHDAVHKISWSEDGGVYRVAFLVGDAPPHMNYANDVPYSITLQEAAARGIVVNTIQSGQHSATRPVWQNIAQLGRGAYFQVEDSGNAVAVATPFDDKLAELAAKLEATRLYFGDEETKKVQKRKLDANDKLRREMSNEALARRATFNNTDSGRSNFLGEGELVDAVTSGRVALEEIEADNLPASLQSMAPVERRAVIERQAESREELRQEIKKFSDSRSRFIQKQLEAGGGADDSLDEKIYGAVKKQAASVGLSYDRDSASY